MKKQNCWEYKNCGREEGGAKTKEFGVCPAATDIRADGINSGKNAGRACWAVAGTLCGGSVQGEYASKMQNCLACEFYTVVQDEEEDDYMLTKEILKQIQ